MLAIYSFQYTRKLYTHYAQTFGVFKAAKCLELWVTCNGCKHQEHVVKICLECTEQLDQTLVSAQHWCNVVLRVQCSS